MGIVNHFVPTIHLCMGLSKVEINGYSTDFAEVISSECGNKQMLKVTKALAMTAMDIFAEPELV